jgi:hypothetical protein
MASKANVKIAANVVETIIKIGFDHKRLSIEILRVISHVCLSPVHFEL